MAHHRFIVGHVLDALKLLPDESVHCVVTSPPYWGLRDYGLPPVDWPEVEYSPMPGLPPLRVPTWCGQLGLEPTPEMYVGHLVLVFREVRRALRRDGTVWVNLGDSYAGSGYGGWENGETGRGLRCELNDKRHGRNKRRVPGLKEKDLVGIPWRVAFALQADGWYFRSDIVWAKENCLPESVKDRPTKSHEYVFLLAKSPRYFYDAEAVKEPAVSHLYDKRYLPGAGCRDRGSESWNLFGPLKPHRGFKVLDTTRGRNRRSVWPINTEPFSGAHFAVFPRRLVELCLLAGTSPRACPDCGAPWERIASTEYVPHSTEIQGPAAAVKELVDWRPGCTCLENDGSGRCVVLDPFGGAGTTMLVAAALGRDSIYIDLKREYAEMALKRLGFTDPQLFAEHTVEVVGLEAERFVQKLEVLLRERQMVLFEFLAGCEENGGGKHGQS